MTDDESAVVRAQAALALDGLTAGGKALQAAVRGDDDETVREAAAKALHAEIKAAVEATPLKARDLFGDFAKAKSEDPLTKASGGDLRFFTAPGAAPAPAANDAPEVPQAVAVAAAAISFCCKRRHSANLPRLMAPLRSKMLPSG